jgi:hypothetical protein
MLSDIAQAQNTENLVDQAGLAASQTFLLDVPCTGIPFSISGSLQDSYRSSRKELFTILFFSSSTFINMHALLTSQS